jgi:hypothetical protein
VVYGRARIPVLLGSDTENRSMARRIRPVKGHPTLAFDEPAEPAGDVEPAAVEFKPTTLEDVQDLDEPDPVEDDSTGFPLGRYVFPAFFRFPRISFFLVSTESAGSPRRWRALTRLAMCSNWALRSGCWFPSRVLRLDCRL